MPKHVRDIIDDALNSGTNADFAKITGTYRFDIEEQGSWLIKIAGGVPSVTKGPGDADCVLACNAEDFDGIMTGRQNLLAAHMQGRLRIEGSPAMALLFIKTLNSRSPHKAA